MSDARRKVNPHLTKTMSLFILLPLTIPCKMTGDAQRDVYAFHNKDYSEGRKGFMKGFLQK